jgi:hypothetical protein
VSSGDCGLCAHPWRATAEHSGEDVRCARAASSAGVRPAAIRNRLSSEAGCSRMVMASERTSVQSCPVEPSADHGVTLMLTHALDHLTGAHSGGTTAIVAGVCVGETVTLPLQSGRHSGRLVLHVMHVGALLKPP